LAARRFLQRGHLAEDPGVAHSLAEVLQLGLGQQGTTVVKQVLLLVVGEEPILYVIHIGNFLGLPDNLACVCGAILDVVDVNVGQTLQGSTTFVLVLIH